MRESYVLPMALAALLAAPAVGRATNVLVIVADDLGADKVEGFADYGASTPYYLPSTPTISQLQAAGVSFTQAWSNPECSPTRAAFHTGLAGFRIGIGQALQEEGTGLSDADWLTLGEVLQNAGWRTGAFGKWHVGSEGSKGTTDWSLSSSDPPTSYAERPPPVVHGFGTYVGELTGAFRDYNGWTRVSYPGLSGPGWTDLEWETRNVDDVVLDTARSWITDQKGPWFALVSFLSPHAEGMPGEPYDASEHDASSCPGDPCVEAGTCADLDGDGRLGDDIALTVYRDLTECMDDRIAQLLAGIPSKQLADTVIVFYGDNGVRDDVLEGTYAIDAGRDGNGKGSVYESGVHVPYVIADGRALLDVRDGLPPKSERFAKVGIEQRAPVNVNSAHDTILELLGLDGPVLTHDSWSLVAKLKHPDAPDSATMPPGVYTEYFENQWETTDLLPDDAAAWRRDDWKLVLNVTWSGGYCYKVELYDLATDPYEWTDLAASEPARASLLLDDVLAIDPDWLPPACP